MSERFGIADHDAQLPGHAPQNPTPSDPVGGAGGFDFPAYNPPAYAGAPAGSYAGTPVGSYAGTSAGPYVRPKRSLILAVVLATVLGPLGLFYVNILSGIAALVIVPVVVRHLAFIVRICVQVPKFQTFFRSSLYAPHIRICFHGDH
jgi:hypothetical protein